MSNVLPGDERERLLKAARETMARAYAPYSKFLVGAAILTELGEIFTGCNVENASYGLTMCAERTAIFSAVAHSGAENVRIRAIAVTTPEDVACSPCGACRQVIYEFGSAAVVLFRSHEGWKEARIRDLLPEGFLLL
ncbi:MAG TPA: cytidine deaminase [Terriglobales bacterium]|nr:cytidine deaminase [Terriglobales bacterium]